MLSLPLIPPRPDASLWPSHRVSNNYFDVTSGEPHGQNTHHGQRRRNSQGHNNNNNNNNNNNATRGYLAALAADENTIYQRKQNVRRFGAGWIRPPGLAKTLQATMDEAAEREEQEALARREQAILDLTAAQTEAANQEAAAEGQEDMVEGERDLDDDVPEADADESRLSETDEESELEEGDTSAMDNTQADMTFNEDSFIEGSMVEAEVEHMLEREEAEMAGVLQDERDLDDDVPEAGSYEHTDTELDYSSDEGGDNSLISNTHISDRRVSILSAGRRRSAGRRSLGLPSARSARTTRTQRSSINPRSSINNPRSSIGPRESLPSQLSNDLRMSIDPRHSINLDANNTSFGLDGSSSLLDGSSFLRSSPVASRGGNLRFQFMGSRAPPRG